MGVNICIAWVVGATHTALRSAIRSSIHFQNFTWFAFNTGVLLKKGKSQGRRLK
jgi:hypothetical protein